MSALKTIYYQEYEIKKDRGKTTLLKIIINMSMDILRATKIKFGAIHSVDPKPMSGTFDSRLRYLFTYV